MKHGADPDAADYDGRTALHLAACEGMRKAVQVLLDGGANKQLRDRWGDTAVTCAEKSGHAAIFAGP